MFVNFICQRVEMVAITEPITVCRDPKDDKFLSLAVSGNADAIITRDADLLVLDPFRGVRIIDAQRFLEWVGA